MKRDYNSKKPWHTGKIITRLSYNSGQWLTYHRNRLTRRARYEFSCMTARWAFSKVAEIELGGECLFDNHANVWKKRDIQGKRTSANILISQKRTMKNTKYIRPVLLFYGRKKPLSRSTLDSHAWKKTGLRPIYMYTSQIFLNQKKIKPTVNNF